MGAPEPNLPCATAPSERPVAEPGWPKTRGERVIFLLDASSGLERRLLEDWVARHRPENGKTQAECVPIPPSRRRRRRDPSERRLEACLAAGDDALLAPLRVAWERERREGERENPLRELLTMGDPRDPGRLRQEWILRRHPSRCHIVAGEPAHVSELRERWRQLGGVDVTHTTGLAEFVVRQATLALERA